jgi:2-haloacid dehalogenase
VVITNIVFDFGNVLIGWNPRKLYAPAFATQQELDFFFENVCTDPWNLALDKGGSFDEAIASKQKEFPHYAEKIGWWKSRWSEMITGEISGTVEILNALAAKGTPLYGLTNWSAETFPYALKNFPFLQHFKNIVVSGQEKCVKPEREIYDLACARWGIAPSSLLFIDDSAKNVAGAIAAGWNAVHFSTPEALAAELTARKLL